MFRTELHIPADEWQITYSDKIISVGSCFANMIGQKLSRNKFETRSNPFGVIFNPISLFKLLSDSVSGKLPEAYTYINKDGKWINLDFHSEINANDKTLLESKVSEINTNTGSFLGEADYLLITLGTAFVYEFKAEGAIVANCHKLPGGFFNKRLLSNDEIVQAFEKFYHLIKKHNPSLKIITTVSPVRHIKDTLPMNAVSKSLLLVAINEIVNKYADVKYFPAYELMMDDLRDYRFYKEDMIHPTEVAENYIWNKFLNTFFEGKTIGFINEWGSILKSMDHRPFDPQSENHQKFIGALIQKIKDLPYPIDFSDELSKLNK